MLELIKSLIIICTLSIVFFYLVKSNSQSIISTKEYLKWRNVLLAVVILAFVSQQVWFFYFLCGAILIITAPKNVESSVAFYIALLFALPVLMVEIPGFGGIRFIFDLSYPRFLVIALLIPLLIRGQLRPKLFKLSTDKYVVLLLLLMSALEFRDNTLTNASRNVFLLVLDIYIPYFVISRALQQPAHLQKSFFALFVAIGALALIGIFETLRHWHLYSALSQTLTNQFIAYDFRSGALRASAIFASPIILGYAMIMALGCLLYLKPLMRSPRLTALMAFILVICMLATFARGPWVGLVVLIAAFIWTGKKRMQQLALLGVSGLIAMIPLSLTSFGQKIISMLPFIGTQGGDTIEYRQRLLDAAWLVFQQQPLFGSPNYRDTVEMEAMRQGQGIIDVVNSYVHVALAYGAFGLLLYVSIFVSLMWQCQRTIKALPDDATDMIHMGRCLFAMLAATMFVIFTVSSIDYIPVIYWTLISMTVAYLNIAKKPVTQTMA